MKGIILAGGKATRMAPGNRETSKHLVQFVLDGHGAYPMILFPILNLKQAGVRDIMIITGIDHGERYMSFLGSGHEYGIDLTYRIQDQAGGIAQALNLCRGFARGERIVVHLGDNILEDDLTGPVRQFESMDNGALVCVKKVSYEAAKSLGVALFKEDSDQIEQVIEKSDSPPSQDAVVGIYMYDEFVFDHIAQQTPSARGELEITDTNNSYAQDDSLTGYRLKGWWQDAGTPHAFNKARDLISKTPAMENKLKLLYV